MSSLQNSAPGSKSAKFVAANPLGPMANPFAGMDHGNEEQDEYAKQLSENVNRRLTKAMAEIKQRHANGTQEMDDPDRAPTGSAYRQQDAIMAKNMRQVDRNRMTTSSSMPMTSSIGNHPMNDIGIRPPLKQEKQDSSSSDSSDDEYDDWINGNGDDDDAELEAIRRRRLNEMREMQAKAAQQRALGHGEVRTITQDEFLPECTGSSEWVAVHFFHSEFERCKIMDHHLKLIAPMHLSCKFLRLDAEKAPFFVQKLKIKTLPTLIVFREGKAVDRLTGFEGLARDPKEPDKWHTGRLQQWIAGTGAIRYKIPDEDVQEEMGRLGFHSKGTIWSGTRGLGFKSKVYNEDEDEE